MESRHFHRGSCCRYGVRPQTVETPQSHSHRWHPCYVQLYCPRRPIVDDLTKGPVEKGRIYRLNVDMLSESVCGMCKLETVRVFTNLLVDPAKSNGVRYVAPFLLGYDKHIYSFPNTTRPAGWRRRVGRPASRRERTLPGAGGGMCVVRQ